MSLSYRHAHKKKINRKKITKAKYIESGHKQMNREKKMWRTAG